MYDNCITKTVRMNLKAKFLQLKTKLLIGIG